MSFLITSAVVIQTLEDGNRDPCLSAQLFILEILPLSVTGKTFQDPDSHIPVQPCT